MKVPGPETLFEREPAVFGNEKEEDGEFEGEDEGEIEGEGDRLRRIGD